MRDYLLKVASGASVLAQRELLKKALAHHLAERHDGERSRYLFSEEPRHPVESDWVRIRCVADGLAMPSGIAMPGPDVIAPAVGRRVVLRAWVALSSEESRGDRIHVARSRFEHHLERLAQPLADVAWQEVADEKSVSIARGRVVFGRRCARLQASGCVSDPEALSSLLRNGIGDAKSYGFGLVDVEPIQ